MRFFKSNPSPEPIWAERIMADIKEPKITDHAIIEKLKECTDFSVFQKKGFFIAVLENKRKNLFEELLTKKQNIEKLLDESNSRYLDQYPLAYAMKNKHYEEVDLMLTYFVKNFESVFLEKTVGFFNDFCVCAGDFFVSLFSLKEQNNKEKTLEKICLFFSKFKQGEYCKRWSLSFLFEVAIKHKNVDCSIEVLKNISKFCIFLSIPNNLLKDYHVNAMGWITYLVEQKALGIITVLLSAGLGKKIKLNSEDLYAAFVMEKSSKEKILQQAIYSLDDSQESMGKQNWYYISDLIDKENQKKLAVLFPEMPFSYFLERIGPLHFENLNGSVSVDLKYN